jgi:hypothetical protein
MSNSLDSSLKLAENIQPKIQRLQLVTDLKLSNLLITLRLRYDKRHSERMYKQKIDKK